MSPHAHLVPDLAGVTPGAQVEIAGAEAHHAVVVRRVQVGEDVALTDGAGRTALGPVVSTGRGRFAIAVTAVTETPRPAPSLVVVQALPKGDRGELAVEVLTEVGVDRVVPWAADRSQVSWRGERGAKALARWRSTAREAAKQSRRAWYPEVADLAATSEVSALLAAADLAVVLHEAAGRSLATLEVPASGTLALVVGPEGGLTDAEIDAFEAAGAAPCRLGTEVLRTSTAGLAAAAALLSRTPRWR